MAAEQIKSASVTNLDATPFYTNTSAQGASGRLLEIDDWVACSGTPLQSTKSFYRLVRVPTGAIIKAVTLATDRALDSGTPTLAFDINIAWSDSTLISSCPLPFQLATRSLAVTEAVIPTTANDGATMTTIAAYASPNKMFGTVTPSSNTLAYGPTDIVFNGLRTAYAYTNTTAQPLWQIFGFVDGRGVPADPGGDFDIIAYVSTAAATGVAGNLYCRVTYAI